MVHTIGEQQDTENLRVYTFSALLTRLTLPSSTGNLRLTSKPVFHLEDSSLRSATQTSAYSRMAVGPNSEEASRCDVFTSVADNGGIIYHNWYKHANAGLGHFHAAAHPVLTYRDQNLLLQPHDPVLGKTRLEGPVNEAGVSAMPAAQIRAMSRDELRTQISIAPDGLALGRESEGNLDTSVQSVQYNGERSRDPHTRRESRLNASPHPFDTEFGTLLGRRSVQNRLFDKQKPSPDEASFPTQRS